jgi:hypothetical protein
MEVWKYVQESPISSIHRLEYVRAKRVAFDRRQGLVLGA